MKKRETCTFGHVIDDLSATLKNDNLEPIGKEAQFLTFLVLSFTTFILLTSIVLGTELVSLRNQVFDFLKFV